MEIGKKIQMEKLWFSPVWSQVLLMQFTLPKVSTERIQVLLREAISLPIKILLKWFLLWFFSLIAYSPLPNAYQDEMVKLQVTLAWYHLPDPAEGQPEICPVAEFPSSTLGCETSCALCVWKLSTLAAQNDICYTQKWFSCLQEKDCLQYQSCVKQSRAWTWMLVSRKFRMKAFISITFKNSSILSTFFLVIQIFQMVSVLLF